MARGPLDLAADAIFPSLPPSGSFSSHIWLSAFVPHRFPSSSSLSLFRYAVIFQDFQSSLPAFSVK